MGKGKVIMVGVDAHQKHTWFDSRGQFGSPIWNVRCSCGRMAQVQSPSAPYLGELWRAHIAEVEQLLVQHGRVSKYGKAPEAPTWVDAACTSCGRETRRCAPFPKYWGPMGVCSSCNGKVRRVAKRSES